MKKDNSKIKKDKRGSYWKNISPEERSIRMSYSRTLGWSRKTKKEIQISIAKLNKARLNKRKKLSTDKNLQKKR